MTAPPQPKIDALHRLRSKFLDEFATLEAAMFEMLHKTGADVHAQHFGQRIELARKNIAEKQSKPPVADGLGAVLDICVSLGCIRNDLVHSRMQLVAIEGVTYAGFANNNQVCPVDSIKPRLLTLEQFKALSKECEKASIALRQA